MSNDATPIPALKQVVLVGDSIRMGYEGRVRERLAGLAEIWTPTANGGTSANLLLMAHLWTEHRQPDLVLFNCGLHDIRTLYFGSREPVTPLSHYLDNLGILLRLMRERTRAALVWASTTPVVDADAHAAHAQWRDFDRYDAEVVRYNAAARELMRAHGVDVLDLYALVAARGAKTMQSGDGVHYTEDGSRALGDAVADFILPRLSPGR